MICGSWTCACRWPVAGGTRREHLGGDDLLVQQSAQYVDLVHGRALRGHPRGVRLRDGRVAVGAVDHQWGPDLAGRQHLLHLVTARVVAARETGLDEPAAVRRLRRDDLETVLGAGGQGCRRRDDDLHTRLRQRVHLPEEPVPAVSGLMSMSRTRQP